MALRNWKLAETLTLQVAPTSPTDSSTDNYRLPSESDTSLCQTYKIIFTMHSSYSTFVICTS